MKSIFDKSISAITSTGEKVWLEMCNSLVSIQKVVNGASVYIRLKKSDEYDQEWDEKHYFVVPFIDSEKGFALHTVRCLPSGVPEVNALPKRRIFHFANEHYEASLLDYMVQIAKDEALNEHSDTKSTIENLANDIDKLETKLTYGMLFVGGVAAIFNPVVGVAIAAKALIPGICGVLNNYGLKPLAENVTKRQLEKHVKDAENQVIKEFAESTTIKINNPILEILDRALNTEEHEYDPLFDPYIPKGDIPQRDRERWHNLSKEALYSVYQNVYKNKRRREKCKLGPEDVRWLETLFANIEEEKK